MTEVGELKRKAMLYLQAAALHHQQISQKLREQAELHEIEAERLIKISRDGEVYK